MMGRIFAAHEANKSGMLAPGYQTHYLHCIDYIRQGVMCAGDVSLEPHSELDGPDNGPLDGGWNGIHGMWEHRTRTAWSCRRRGFVVSLTLSAVCKNYDEVTRYLEGRS